MHTVVYFLFSLHKNGLPDLGHLIRASCLCFISAMLPFCTTCSSSFPSSPHFPLLMWFSPTLVAFLVSRLPPPSLPFLRSFVRSFHLASLLVVPCRSDVSYTRIDKSIVCQQEGPGICRLPHPSRPRSLPATLSEFLLLLTIPNLSLSLVRTRSLPFPLESGIEERRVLSLVRRIGIFYFYIWIQKGLWL